VNYPIIFPVLERLYHKGEQAVRDIAARNGFKLADAKSSEIWYRLCGRGYAVIRIDVKGHQMEYKDGPPGGVPAGVHGGVPHYHKEWVSAEYFARYLERYVPQVVRYNDFGDPVTGAMTDGKAKVTHIRR
jgi:hypothetical protein